jgi:hypothetical protein
VKRKAARQHMPKVYHPDAFILISEAINLLADRDRRLHDSDRVRKARMRQHIMYAVNNGELEESFRHRTKRYVYGRIVAWAQDKWPGRYSDLVAIRDPIVGRLEASLPRLVVRSSGYQIPTTLPECQAELVQAMETIRVLQARVTVACGDADRLRPDAEAWQHHCEVNRANARQLRPRDGKDFL